MDRKTFTDSAQEHSKKIPCPTKYETARKPFVPLGTISKAEGVDIMSDTEYVALLYPGPNHY